MFRTPSVSPLLLAGSLLLAACGSSSSKAPGGGAGLQISRGAITEKTGTTIRVNGVAVETQGATVRIEKVERPETELQKGMVVTVKGTFDDRTGTATEIDFEDAVKGRVVEKSSDNLSVGGQLVRVDDSTEFEDGVAGLAGVAVGDRVRVSAVPDDQGGLCATRIDKVVDASEDFEVKGFVSGLSAVGFTLKASDASSGFTVTYAAGVVAPAGLADGAFVEVRAAGPAVAGALVATSISLEDRFGEATDMEIEGIVSSGGSASFVVDGQPVSTSAATVWRLGVAGDLVPGVKVEVEGHLDAQGVLAAEKVSFRASIRITAPVAALVVTGPSSATLTLLGVPVSLSDFTDWRLPAGTLANGTVVELRGILGRDGASVVATRVEATNDTRVSLQGPVSAKDSAAGALTLLGVTVATSGAELKDTSDAVVTAAAFFAAVEPGRTVVKALGRDASALSGGTLTAVELELEGDE